MTTQILSAGAEKTILRRSPWLGLVALAWILSEKMVAHIYLVTLIYAGIPHAIAYGIAFVLGALGLFMVWRGLSQDNEVKATWLGYMGGAFIWVFWFEMYLHFIGQNNMFALAYHEGEVLRLGPDEVAAAFRGEGPAPYFMGEHVFLQSSSLFCFMVMIYLFMNPDVRCRMLLWFRKILRLRPGRPTSGYKPLVARVAAMEVMFVNWFMYTVMLLSLDERIFGLHHPVSYAITAGISLWTIYILRKLVAIKESGLLIRYAIGVGGVFWFVPEITTLWGWYREPWVWYLEYPATATAILVIYIACAVFFWRAPVNPDTGKGI